MSIENRVKWYEELANDKSVSKGEREAFASTLDELRAKLAHK